MANKTGGGVGTNQYEVKGRAVSVETAAVNASRAADVAAGEPPKRDATVWFHKFSPESVNRLMDAGLTPVDVEGRYDGEPVVVYRLPSGKELEALIYDFGDWSEVRMCGRGVVRHSERTQGDTVDVVCANENVGDADDPMELEDLIRDLAYVAREELDRAGEAAIVRGDA